MSDDTTRQKPLLESIDENARRRFEAAWREGRPEPIEHFLPPVDHPLFRATLEELVRRELELAWENQTVTGGNSTTRVGRPPLVEAYLERFPPLNQPSIVLRLLQQEYQLRQRRGDQPSVEEYRRRFPQLTFGAAEPGRSSSSSPALPSVFPDIPDYEILSELGRGGMGVVYKAQQRSLKRVVALKMILAGGHSSAEVRARFRAEAEAVARLQHPNIVQIHAIGEQEGRLFFVLELVEGGSLAQRLAGKPVPPEPAAALVGTLARAMHFAHQRGIVHRDLKPANILLASGVASAPRDRAPGADVTGLTVKNFPGADAARLATQNSPGADATGLAACTPKITDFGLAKMLEADAGETRSGAILGTPAYMAPEQAAGQTRAIGPWTDVYGLGAILFELLTGRPPFRAATIAATLEQVQNRDPLPPSRLRSKIPRDLETICLKCLAKEPAQRYSSALALAEDLDRFQAHEPIKARPVGALGRLARWCRRNPALAATLALATVLIGVVAGIGLWRVVEERNRFREERDHAQRERDRAEANLYRALVGEARAQMKARDTGWWWQAMANLRTAGRLDVAARDPAALRDLAVECMGTQYPCFRLRETCAGHNGPVTAVAISPDGRLAATGGRDQMVRLWSLPDGEPLAVLTEHRGPVNGVAFHPFSQRLASGSMDGTVRLWSLGEGNWPTGDSLEPSAGRRPRVGGPHVSLDLKAGPVRAVAFSPDGAWLAAACQNATVHVLPATGGRAVQILPGHSGAVTCLAFSPLSGRLASGGLDRTIRLWDVATGKPTASWAIQSLPSALAFNPVVERLLSGYYDSHGFTVKDLASNRDDPHGGVHTGAILQAQADRHGRWLTASEDGDLKLWTTHREHHVEQAVARGECGAVLCAALNPQGDLAVAGYVDGRLRLWDLVDPPFRALLPYESQNAVFLGRERRLASLSVYDFSRGLQARGVPYAPAAIRALAVHPDGGRFAFGRDDGTLAVWQLRPAREQARWQGHRERIVGLASSPDGRHLASASADGTVRLWHWDDGRPVRTLQPELGGLHAVAWSRNGRYLATTGARGVVVWDVDGTPKVLWRSEQTLTSSGVAFGLDRVACCGAGGTVEVRDPYSGQVSQTLRGPANGVSVLAFAPDGRSLAAADRNGTTRLWEVSTGQEQAVLEQREASISALAFSPQGRYLITGGGNLVWDLRTKAAIANFFLRTCCCQFVDNGTAVLLGTQEGAVLSCTVAEIDRARAAAVGPGKEGILSGPVRIDPRTTLVPGGHIEAVWGIAASPDGRWLATASHDQTIKLWDARTMQLRRTLTGHGNIVWGIAFSPDSQYLASGSALPHAGEVKVWEVASGRQRYHFEGHSRLVTALAFHPCRPWLASGSLDGSVRLWDLAAGRPLGLLHQLDQAVYSLAYRPDGRWLAAACLDQRVALWDGNLSPTRPTPPEHRLTGHTAGVWSVRFSADGRYLASGSEQGIVILWDGDTFERRVTLRGGTGQIRGLCFSRDGELLAGACYYAPTIVWDLAQVRTTLQEMNLDWP